MLFALLIETAGDSPRGPTLFTAMLDGFAAMLSAM